ncbi:MAG TPA: hypothetical protein VHV31_14415, partial [Nitrolancea sp.]|nr:hypothetical protein [Nitrolancea sp.]
MSASERTDLVLAVDGEVGIVTARSEARVFARELGFGLVDQSRIATAVSELTRNIVRYATNGCGEVVIRQVTSLTNRPGIEIVVS